TDNPKRVTERHWAAGLCFRVTSNQFRRAPECPLPILDHDPKRFPTPPRIEHEPDLGFRPAILLDFLKDSFRVRGMMHDAKRIDEVVWLHRDERAQLLGVAAIESCVESVHFQTTPGDLETFLRQLHRRQIRTVPSEIDRVCPDSATNLQHCLAPPALELGKTRDMRLHEILSRFDFIEVLAGANELR